MPVLPNVRRGRALDTPAATLADVYDTLRSHPG